MCIELLMKHTKWKMFYDFLERAEVLRSSNVVVMIHDRQLGRPD